MLRSRISFLVSLFLLISVTVYAAIPQPVGYVNDFAHILKPQTVKELNSIILQIKRKTGVEIAVVTIKSTEGDDIFDYSMKLFEKWGIGEKGKDNGVLFLVDIGDRKLRINTGYGVEGILPDGLLGRIRDRYILPYFRKGDYDDGILNGVKAIAATIAKAYNVKLDKSVSPVEAKRGKLSSIDIILLFAALFFILPFFMPMMFGFFLGSYRTGWDSPLGGGFGGGGLGGGFGGFGGGSSGGGGVGGSW